MPARFHGAVGHVDGLAGRLAEGLYRAGDFARLGNLVERHFGGFDLLERLHIDRGVSGGHRHFATDADELAQQREVIDLLGEIASGDERARMLRQSGEIGGAAELNDRRIGLEQWFQRDRGGGHLAVAELEDRLVDAAVQRLGEMLRAEYHHDVFDQPVVDHQRAEQRLLGLEILRQGGDIGDRFDDPQRQAVHGGDYRPARRFRQSHRWTALWNIFGQVCQRLFKPLIKK